MRVVYTKVQSPQQTGYSFAQAGIPCYPLRPSTKTCWKSGSLLICLLGGCCGCYPGRLTDVQISLGKEHATISAQAVVLKQLNYLGSRGGTRQDVAKVLDLIASGSATSNVTPITFDEIGDAMGDLV
jgi:hypothetical protein